MYYTFFFNVDAVVCLNNGQFQVWELNIWQFIVIVEIKYVLNLNEYYLPIFILSIHVRQSGSHAQIRTSNNAKSNPEIKGRNSIFFFRHDALQINVETRDTAADECCKKNGAKNRLFN
jgi:hypothetical protein